LTANRNLAGCRNSFEGKKGEKADAYFICAPRDRPASLLRSWLCRSLQSAAGPRFGAQKKGTPVKKKPLTLDEIDHSIIRELQRNGRESYKNIARKLNVSDGTVRLRTERMIREGYLRISASVNPLFFGDTLTAMIGITLSIPANRALMNRVSSLTAVQSVINVTGRYDLILEVFVQSRKDMHRFLVEELASISEITSTESFIYLEAMNKWVEFKV
jgi:Lrp/AsnC family transcriptional regulator for asnA, asnC and gidA